MKIPTGPLVYDFNRSYYENAYGNFLASYKVTSEIGTLMSYVPGNTEANYWYAEGHGTTTKIIEGVDVDAGVDITEYVQKIYDGEQRLCFIDNLAKQILDIPIIGGLLPCSVRQLVFDIIDGFTDLFGTFICTATLKTTPCGEDLIELLKEYREEVAATMEDSDKILKYYTIVGPRIVKAINKDSEGDHVYNYLGAEYIHPLIVAMKTKDYDTSVKLYFRMLDEMVSRYDIKTLPVFKEWVERYA
jgi:hypothetical protein